MRGAPWWVLKDVCDARIIPADAGSTIVADLDGSHAGDHPRGCGEHIVIMFGLAFFGGSSPRMRGALKQIPIQGSVVGIIPADAGSTEDKLNNFDVQSGPSPRMRGAQEKPQQSLPVPGIIPADAGSTRCRPTD